MLISLSDTLIGVGNLNTYLALIVINVCIGHQIILGPNLLHLRVLCVKTGGWKGDAPSCSHCCLCALVVASCSVQVLYSCLAAQLGLLLVLRIFGLQLVLVEDVNMQYCGVYQVLIKMTRERYIFDDFKIMLAFG